MFSVSQQELSKMASVSLQLTTKLAACECFGFTIGEAEIPEPITMAEMIAIRYCTLEYIFDVGDGEPIFEISTGLKDSGRVILILKL